jgi:hypothetical protein
MFREPSLLSDDLVRYIIYTYLNTSSYIAYSDSYNKSINSPSADRRPKRKVNYFRSEKQLVGKTWNLRGFSEGAIELNDIEYNHSVHILVSWIILYCDDQTKPKGQYSLTSDREISLSLVREYWPLWFG